MAHAGLQSLQLEKYARVRLHYHRSRREVARLGDLINLIRQGGP